MRDAPKIQRALLVRTDRIGDVVLSLPAAALLKHRLPEAEVHFLTRAYTAPLAAMAPDINAVVIDDGLPAWDLAHKLRAGGYQAAVLLHPTLRLASALFLAGIPNRVGTAYRGYSIFLNRRVPQHRRQSQHHELELNLELVRGGLGLGDEGQDRQKYYPKIVVSSEQKKATRSSLDLSSDNLVVVHPGSGGSARDWPWLNFARLIDRLASHGFQMAVTLGPGEEGLGRALKGEIKASVRWISGLDLGRLAAVLSLSRLVISNSTGPLHLATAVGSRALGIYCPIEPCLPRRWGPYGPGHAVLSPEVPPCRSCIGRRCRHWDCMESITVDSVITKSLEMLS